MEFSLLIPVPSFWGVWLEHEATALPLWILPQPANDVPITVPVSIPNVPPIGLITIHSGVWRGAGICATAASVDTAPAVAAASEEMLQVQVERPFPFTLHLPLLQGR